MPATRATAYTSAPPPYVTATVPPASRDEAARAADFPAPWTARALRGLQFTLAAVFVVAGAATLAGAAEAAATFGTIENVLGLGDWLRVATGLLEVLGGLLLCARASAGVGAVLLGTVMAAAAAADLVVFGAVPVWPAVLLAGLAAVAYAHRAALRVVAAVLERNL